MTETEKRLWMVKAQYEYPHFMARGTLSQFPWAPWYMAYLEIYPLATPNGVLIEAAIRPVTGGHLPIASLFLPNKLVNESANFLLEAVQR